MKQTLQDQYTRALAMFREAIQAFPESEWRVGDSDFQRPASLAQHTTETIDFYTSDLSAKDFPWQERFGISWEEKDSTKLPSQAQITTYLDEMEVRLEDWLEKTDFSAPETLHPYTSKTILGRAIYLLRHTQHHTAQLGLELHRRGLEGPEWK